MKIKLCYLMLLIAISFTSFICLCTQLKDMTTFNPAVINPAAL